MSIIRVGVRTVLRGELLQWRGHLGEVFIWVREVVGCKDKGLVYRCIDVT